MLNSLLLLPFADPAPDPAGAVDATTGGAADATGGAADATTGAATGAVKAVTAAVHHSHTGWTIGIILFLVVVVVVVALVVPIIALAARIGHQAPAINDSL